MPKNKAQNHGFAVDDFESDLVHEKFGRIESYASNLNDGSNEGISICLLYTSPSPRDRSLSRMPSSA